MAGHFKVAVLALRTQMVGGGTSYDVYVPVRTKVYRPIAGNCYATVMMRDGREYYSVADWLRDEAIDALPALTEQRWQAFKRLERVAKRLEARIAKRVFPELGDRTELPLLWASWSLPSEEHKVRICVNGRNYARVCGVGKAVAS